MEPTYKVDIPRIVRWLFRSQTTYEVHPHLIRFTVGMPEDPRGHSRQPLALLDAAPAAAASVDTTADPFTSCVIEEVLKAPPIEPERHLLSRPPSIASTHDLSKDAVPDAHTTPAARNAGTAAAVQALLDSTPACTDAAVGEAAFDASSHAAPDAEGAAAEAPRRSVAWASDVMRRAGASAAAAAAATGALHLHDLHLISNIHPCVFCVGGMSGVRGPHKAPAYAPCCPIYALLPCWCVCEVSVCGFM